VCVITCGGQRTLARWPEPDDIQELAGEDGQGVVEVKSGNLEELQEILLG
jgi:hypothetical protein